MLQPRDQPARRSKNIHKPVAIAGDVILSFGVLFGVSHEESSADVLNIEGRKIAMYTIVVERVLAQPHTFEICVVNLDSSAPEVRDVQKALAIDVGAGEPLVNRAVSRAMI